MEKKLEWEFVQPLKSVDLIDEFEQKVKFKFPESFRNLVISSNAGYPNKYVFDTDVSEEEVFDSLLSFNHEDKCNVFDFYDGSSDDFEELGKTYVQFACGGFGDPIAFDPETGHVICVDHETLEIKLIAETFDEFLGKLRDCDDEEEEKPAEEIPVQQKPAKKSIFSFPFFKKK